MVLWKLLGCQTLPLMHIPTPRWVEHTNSTGSCGWNPSSSHLCPPWAPSSSCSCVTSTVNRYEERQVISWVSEIILGGYWMKKGWGLQSYRSVGGFGCLVFATGAWIDGSLWGQTFEPMVFDMTLLEFSWFQGQALGIQKAEEIEHWCWKTLAVRMLLVKVLRIATNLPGRGPQVCHLWVPGSLYFYEQTSLLTSLDCKGQELV